jgi:hypothetical protein
MIRTGNDQANRQLRTSVVVNNHPAFDLIFGSPVTIAVASSLNGTNVVAAVLGAVSGPLPDLTGEVELRSRRFPYLVALLAG